MDVALVLIVIAAIGIGLALVLGLLRTLLDYWNDRTAERLRKAASRLDLAGLPGAGEADALFQEAVDVLDERGGWLDRDAGARICQRLRQIPDAPYVAAIERVGSHHPGGGRAAVLAIRLGRPGSEPALSNVLSARHDSSLAVEYLNSGSERLDRIAGDWAARNGYGIIQRTGSSFARWGDTGLDNGGT